MATNQYQGRQETDKIDFGKMSPEEQQEFSRRHISEEQDERPVNEQIAQKEKAKLDRLRADRIK